MSFLRTRPVVGGLHGAVASAHPLASQAGLDALRTGGNAVDAVVTMAAALNVVEPYMSGVGGVGLLLLHRPDGSRSVLNFTGNTPARATPEQYTPESQALGAKACLIPGNVAGWLEALRRQGTRSAREAFAPAIRFAQEGFPLHPLNARLIQTALPRLNEVGRGVFGLPAIRVGAVLKQPDLARTLAHLADQGSEYFYRGPLAQRIADYVATQGGFLSATDLQTYEPEWQDPIEVDYRGYRVRTCAPNCEGFQILQTLKLLESYDLRGLGHNSVEYVHLLSEAIKLATADRIQWGGDPKFLPVPLETLLSERYVADRRQRIRLDGASYSEGERWRGERNRRAVPPGQIEGLTTHLAAVDRLGNVASLTHSLGDAFGSGVMVPETGVLLNNFVFWTEIDPRCPTPNLLQPGRRWSCCMSPVQVFLPDGRFWFSIATPGSYGILQTTVQMLLNVIEFGADVQQAIEAPRFRVYEDTRMQIEGRFPNSVCDGLTARGHVLEKLDDYSMFVGGGQAVMVDPESGARLGGADPRRDGYALAY